MMLIEETAPDVTALPMAALRDYLRFGSGFELAADPAEDRALAGFLRAAIATIEARTGKVLLRRQYAMRLDDWRDRLGQALPLSPVLTVDAVEIEDAEGHVTTVPPSQWHLVADTQRPILAPSGVILPHVPRRGSVMVRFTAGFGAQWEQVPTDLAQAAVMLAAMYYEDRSFDGSVAAMPFSVSALIEKWRGVRSLAGRGRA